MQGEVPYRRHYHEQPFEYLEQRRCAPLVLTVANKRKKHEAFNRTSRDNQ